MSFGGNIATMPFPDLLQWLCMGGKTGTLTVTHGSVVKVVFFRQGTVVAARSNQIKDHLGKHLIRNEVLTKEQVKQALEISKRDKSTPFPTICVKLGFVPEHEMLDMIRSNSESILYGMFSMNEGVFSFEEGQLPEEQLVPITLTANDLLMKGIKLRNEWESTRQKLGGDDVVLSSFPELDASLLGLTSVEEEVFSLVDGSRTISEIVSSSPLSDMETFRLLGRFLDGGYVVVEEPMSEPSAEIIKDLNPPKTGSQHRVDVLSEAQELIASRKYEEASETLKSLLQLFPDHTEAKAMLTQCQKARVEDMLDTVGGDESIPRLAVPLTDPIFQSMKLTAQEGFLLSRIDGNTTLKYLANLTRIPLEEVFQIVYDLVKKNLVVVRKPNQSAAPRPGMNVGSSARSGSTTARPAASSTGRSSTAPPSPPRERTVISEKKKF